MVHLNSLPPAIANSIYLGANYFLINVAVIGMTYRNNTENVRTCPACELEAYPRMSPAAIVLVRRDKQILLARGIDFPQPFYSTLAGFVEPGETLEDAIHREIFEEVGIWVKNLRYFGSQSWPFPHSLMVGFIADFDSGEIEVAENEIVDAGWFDPTDLPLIPPARVSPDG